MLDFLESLIALNEALNNWRAVLGMILTAILVFVVCSRIPDIPMRWICGVPLAILGIYLSFRWQDRAEKRP